MQVYFIDNEEYFKRKFTFRDDKGKFYADNDERMAFYCRGVIETVRKLGWAPDVIHCQGWMTSLMPYYLKTLFNEDPVFANSKIVYSVYDNEFKEKLSKNFVAKLGLKDEWISPELSKLNNANYVDLTKFAIGMSDAVIIGSEKINDEVNDFVSSLNVPTLGYHSAEDYADAYSEFYDDLLISEPEMAQ
jgi:starch synthase